MEENNRFSTCLLLFLLVALFVALYIVVGGDFRFWQQTGSGGGILEGIIHGVGSVGDGISRGFSGFFH
jgi:hypothetical protein